MSTAWNIELAGDSFFVFVVSWYLGSISVIVSVVWVSLSIWKMGSDAVYWMNGYMDK
jgi:hypothetical protein